MTATNCICNVCFGLCLNCKNKHASNDHIIRNIHESSSPTLTIEFREGFRKTDPLGIYRKNQISNFFEEISSAKKILFRSPPYSGKTAFAWLMYLHLEGQGKNVFYITFSSLANPNDASFSKYWQKEVGQTWQDLFLDSSEKIIILDETQRIYDDKLEFWGFFKNPKRQIQHLTLICFAGYGDQSTHFKSMTPISFDRAFGMDVLSFNKEEFEEIIGKFQDNYKIEITPRIKEHLKRTINNHCGLLKETLYFIATQTKNIKNIDELLLFEFTLFRSLYRSNSGDKSRSFSKNF